MTWTFRRPHQYRPQNRLGHDFRVLLYAAGAMSGVATLSFGDSATLGGTGELAASESMTLSASAIPGNTNPNELVGTAGLTFGESAVLTGSRLTKSLWICLEHLSMQNKCLSRRR